MAAGPDPEETASSASDLVTTPPPIDPAGETAPLGRSSRVDPGSSAPLLEATALEPPPSSAGPDPPSASLSAPSGQVGEFELLHELARGGMGVVWVARSRRLGRRVALKLLRGEQVGPEARERFQIEARAAARLRHPHIVGVHEVGEADGAPYLVMDLIEGESLQARLRREGRLPPREAARIGALLARALAYAHAHAILHRDVKPANVLLDGEGQPVLTDFGLAKELETDSGGPTRTGQLMGTPAYMPPEQVRGELEQIDRRADVWSLGALLYQALTGSLPFPAGNTSALLLKILHHEPVPPRRLCPQLDRDLETIVLRCLEKEPEARYASAQALAEDLERWLSDLPIAARRPGAPERLRKWARRNRSLTIGLVLALLVGLGAGGVGVGVHLVQLERERQLADRRAQVALDALTVLIGAVQDELRPLQDARARELRRRLLEDALAGLDRLRELELSGAAEQRQALLRRVQAGRLRGELEEELGRRERARRALAQAEQDGRALLALLGPDPGAWEARRELSIVLDLRGDMHRVAGETAAARACWEESRRLSEALLRERPGEPRGRRDLAIALGQLARLESDDGDAERALILAEQAVAECRRLSEGSAHLDELAEALLQLSHAQQACGQAARALGSAGEALALGRLALLRQASRPRLHRLIAALNQLGRVWNDLQEPARGRPAQTEARRLAELALREDPDAVVLQAELASSLGAEATLTGGAPGAELARRAVALRRQLLARDPDEREPLRRLGEALLVLARLELELERPAAAATAAAEAEGLARRALGDGHAPALQDELAEALDVRGVALQASGELAGADAALEQALALRRAVCTDPAAGAVARRGLLVSLEHLAELRLAGGEQAAARALLEEACQRAAVIASAGAPAAAWDQAILVTKLANLLQDSGDPAGARARFHEALAALRIAAASIPGCVGAEEGLARHVGMQDLAAADTPGEPRDPAAHLARAYALALRGELAAAHPHFQAALTEERWRSDLVLAHLRCAAEVALAAGEPAVALERLREDTRRRQVALRELERELSAAQEPARRAVLEARCESLRAPLEALPHDPTWAALAEDPGYQALLRAAADR